VQGTPWDRAILAPIESVWWVHGLPVGHALDHERVWSNGPQGPPKLSRVPVGPPWQVSELPELPAIVVSPTSFAGAYAIRGAYRDAARGTLAVFPAEVLVRLYAILGDVRDLVATISVLTQVMVIGAVLLAVIAGLAQRRRLIGVLRALGASRAFVFGTVWLYVAVTLGAGAALGHPTGLLGASLVSAVLERRSMLDLPVGIGGAELLLVGVVMIIALVLATIPGLLAYRGSVSDALRE
jgi:putative ABC transport system permease protein